MNEFIRQIFACPASFKMLHSLAVSSENYQRHIRMMKVCECHL